MSLDHTLRENKDRAHYNRGRYVEITQRHYVATSRIRGRMVRSDSVRKASAMGSLKRRGPALPGLTYSTPVFVTMFGRCECPETTTSIPAAAGSSSMPLRLCST